MWPKQSSVACQIKEARTRVEPYQEDEHEEQDLEQPHSERANGEVIPHLEVGGKRSSCCPTETKGAITVRVANGPTVLPTSGSALATFAGAVTWRAPVTAQDEKSLLGCDDKDACDDNFLSLNTWAVFYFCPFFR